MKIVLTGGSGYIGSVTTELLCDDGHEVVVFDNLERGHREAVDPRARLVVGDLREPQAIRELLAAVKPDAVVHFAAYALVGESMQNPHLYFENNVGGGLHLLDAMLRTGVRKIIFSSTCATYGQPDVLPMTEALPQRPTNPYGESKLMFETALRWEQARRGIQPTFLRYFNACGAMPGGAIGEDHRPESHLIPIVLQAANGTRPSIAVYGTDYPTRDGTCVRDYIHVCDLAQAHVLAVRYLIDDGKSDVFNLGNGIGFTVLEVLKAAEKVVGHEIPTVLAGRRAGDPATLVASSEKARSVLGWKPQYADIETILETAWQWHSSHPNGYGK